MVMESTIGDSNIAGAFVVKQTFPPSPSFRCL